jgi:hypothetical protein
MRREMVRIASGPCAILIWLTIVCGIGGVLIGGFIYTAFGSDAARASTGCGGSSPLL